VLIAAIKRWLAHPRTRGLNLDDPRTTHIRRQIIRETPFLRRIYEEWYGTLGAALPPGDAPVLELGSGGGFLEEFVPGLVTSEIFYCPYIRVVLDGLRLPFRDQSLRGIVMTNVLHHLPRPQEFFREASRCVRPGGAIAVVEPWVTPWSRFVFQHFHHEPFDPAMPGWEFPTAGPLSGANGALPWILFQRDRERFVAQFPQWRIEQIRPCMPLRYLLSGGVGLRCLMPGWVFPVLRAAEGLCPPCTKRLAMFACVTLRRAGQDADAGGDLNAPDA